MNHSPYLQAVAPNALYTAATTTRLVVFVLGIIYHICFKSYIYLLGFLIIITLNKVLCQCSAADQEELNHSRCEHNHMPRVLSK